MIHYWESGDYKALHEAKEYADLLPIALRILDRMPPPIVLVAGPISTGGSGSIEENLHILSAAIDLVYSKGISVLDQNPFEDKMQELRESHNPDGSSLPLLEAVHQKILESGKINKVYFLPDWQTSIGSKWEYEQCKRLRIKTEDFPQEWFRELK